MRCLFLLLALTAAPAFTADWPMWRMDAARTASSTERLPGRLHLEWERVYPPRQQVWDDPLNHDLMPYDKVFEPVVLGGRLFIGFNDADKVVALDLKTGAELWSFHADAPVRLPAACWQGKVYFTSDDGRLYCVKADDGTKLWSFNGAPSARKALGNRRITAAWPARGGVVVRDGKVCFAASIWPFMGTFLYALDAESGALLWVNDGTGADFIKQPHSAPAFAGVAPQGALAAAGGTLLVPGGRSVPAGFDLATGALKFFHLNEGGKGNGGSFVAAGEKSFYVHTRERGVRAFDLKSGLPGRTTMNEPVIDGSRLFDSDAGGVREIGAAGKVLWEVRADGSGDLIKAGDHLYAAGARSLNAISLVGPPALAWTLPVDGGVRRLIAADGRLIAVTLDGRILVYGTGTPAGRLARQAAAPPVPSEEAVKLARALLGKIEDAGGHALVFGGQDPGLVDALLQESRMSITVVDADSARVESARRAYDACGLYGSRITFHAGDAKSFQAPPHFAHLVIAPADQASAAFASVRPYGGLMLCPAATETEQAAFEGSRVEGLAGRRLVIREGPLPGAADWTHQYGDIGNTVKSDDTRVRAPLGVLWFGGSSNLDVLPRHGHGPPEQVVGGRLFIEGMNSISARDVYTGRVIWKHDFEDLGTFGIYYNETYADTPLSTAYNQKHIPGANGRGTNYVATADAVHVAVKGGCQVLDSRNGRLLRTIPLREDAGDPAQWAFIGVSGDLLIGGDDFAHFSLRTGSSSSRAGAPIEDFSASAGLAVFDRYSGRLLWRVKARHSFLHNAIVAGGGRIYCIDKLTRHAEGLLARRGLGLPEDYRVVAFEAATGRVLWEESKGVFGTWLGYSAKHDILLQAGAQAKDRLATEVGEGMTAHEGKSGRVRWQDLRRSYTGPCILHNELIFTGANSYSSSGGAFSLLTGEPHLVMNPLTGNKEPWRLNRTYGCNTVIASEHLLTFRSGAAGFYDLESMSGTSNLGGFKSGCTSNLVAANGVLNAPDYTRTCSCAYQNQTSLALIHMPDVELWSYSQFGLDAKEGERVLRAGVNFGAPGNRRASDGTLWLEHPHVGTGNAPRLGIEGLGKEVRWFRRHSSQVAETAQSHGWILASGFIGEAEVVITPALRRPVLGKPPGKSDDEEGRPAAGGKIVIKPAPRTPASAPSAETDQTLRPHTVRLHFSEPEKRSVGERVFDVTLQGRQVIERLDLGREGGGTVREFRGVLVGPELRIGLKPAAGSKAPPVLCGVEFVAE